MVEERRVRRVNGAVSFRETHPSAPRSPFRGTVSAADYHAARAEWDAGDFSAEWKPWRHRAAMECGIVYPPAGTPFDCWEDDQPSQRAILIRAIRETPALLAESMRGARSWGQVVDRLLRARDDWRADQRAPEVCRLADDVPTQLEAAQALHAILRRIGDS